MRNRADGFGVGRDVIAFLAVAARQRLDQFALFIAQADGDAVHLGFDDVFGRIDMQALPGTRIEFAQLLEAVGVVQRDHRHRMGHALELAGGFGAHPPGWRIGGRQCRMPSFQILQLAQQAVEFRVGDFGRGLVVIEVAVPFQLLLEKGGTGFVLGRDGGG